MSIAETIRHRIESGGERIWRFADFERMPVRAVAQALATDASRRNPAVGKGPLLPAKANSLRTQPAKHG